MIAPLEILHADCNDEESEQLIGRPSRKNTFQQFIRGWACIVLVVGGLLVIAVKVLDVDMENIADFWHEEDDEADFFEAINEPPSALNLTIRAHVLPTFDPTSAPSSAVPTAAPTLPPTIDPTFLPTAPPTYNPTATTT